MLYMIAPCFLCFIRDNVIPIPTYFFLDGYSIDAVSLDVITIPL